MQSVELNQAVNALVVAARGKVCRSRALIVIVFDLLLICCLYPSRHSRNMLVVMGATEPSVTTSSLSRPSSLYDSSNR